MAHTLENNFPKTRFGGISLAKHASLGCGSVQRQQCGQTQVVEGIFLFVCKFNSVTHWVCPKLRQVKWWGKVRSSCFADIRIQVSAQIFKLTPVGTNKEINQGSRLQRILWSWGWQILSLRFAWTIGETLPQKHKRVLSALGFLLQ